jgi:hypothetical protein
MTERFTAQQAREASTPVAHDYEVVIQDIKEACRLEKNCVYWYREVDKATVALLEQDGFIVVITYSCEEGDTTSIKW